MRLFERDAGAAVAFDCIEQVRAGNCDIEAHQQPGSGSYRNGEAGEDCVSC